MNLSFISLEQTPRRLLGHMVSVCLTSEETPRCFPEWLRHFAVAPTTGKFQLRPILDKHGTVSTFHWSYSIRYKAASPHGFNLLFPNA